MYQALNRDELLAVYAEIDELEPEMYDSRSFRPQKPVLITTQSWRCLFYTSSHSVW